MSGYPLPRVRLSWRLWNALRRVLGGKRVLRASESGHAALSFRRLPRPVPEAPPAPPCPPLWRDSHNGPGGEAPLVDPRPQPSTCARFFRRTSHLNGVHVGYVLYPNGKVDEVYASGDRHPHPSMDVTMLETHVGYGLLEEVPQL